MAGPLAQRQHLRRLADPAVAVAAAGRGGGAIGPRRGRAKARPLQRWRPAPSPRGGRLLRRQAADMPGALRRRSRFPPPHAAALRRRGTRGGGGGGRRRGGPEGPRGGLAHPAHVAPDAGRRPTGRQAAGRAGGTNGGQAGLSPMASSLLNCPNAQRGRMTQFLRRPRRRSCRTACQCRRAAGRRVAAFPQLPRRGAPRSTARASCHCTP